MTAYRKFRKRNRGIGFRNRERLFPVLPIIKTFLTCDRKHTYFFIWPDDDDDDDDDGILKFGESYSYGD